MRTCNYCKKEIFDLKLFCSDKCKELYFLDVGDNYEIPEILGTIEKNT